MTPEQPQTKVLVIEDEAPVRDSFHNFLEDQGYAVFEATNGREGIEQFDQCQPDVVLIDLRMPVMNGQQVLERLAPKAPDTPLIIISGTGHIGDTIEALHLGAWDYLLKPVADLDMLDHAITAALERARLIAENREYQKGLEIRVEERTRELNAKVEELTRFNRMAVGRERRIIELKRQINNLQVELGREPQYKSPQIIDEDPSLLD
ncbi:Chemotaxis protein CheY [Pontiella desulfatans]|uniref:Chemotaxis protein CheY n=1 Tax=Pontiella desulfatans TaxID=2750659 RepID=A0A6C2UA87_PONDE|nr:response regulator [Pontiella desulfatans]VGO16950.1 Chemotaxis protein CheY [Pontiella desulfatans]